MPVTSHKALLPQEELSSRAEANILFRELYRRQQLGAQPSLVTNILAVEADQLKCLSGEDSESVEYKHYIDRMLSGQAELLNFINEARHLPDAFFSKKRWDLSSKISNYIEEHVGALRAFQQRHPNLYVYCGLDEEMAVSTRAFRPDTKEHMEEVCWTQIKHLEARISKAFEELQKVRQGQFIDHNLKNESALYYTVENRSRAERLGLIAATDIPVHTMPVYGDAYIHHDTHDRVEGVVSNRQQHAAMVSLTRDVGSKAEQGYITQTFSRLAKGRIPSHPGIVGLDENATVSSRSIAAAMPSSSSSDMSPALSSSSDSMNPASSSQNDRVADLIEMVKEQALGTSKDLDERYHQILGHYRSLLTAAEPTRPMALADVLPLTTGLLSSMIASGEACDEKVRQEQINKVMDSLFLESLQDKPDNAAIVQALLVLQQYHRPNAAEKSSTKNLQQALDILVGISPLVMLSPNKTAVLHPAVENLLQNLAQVPDKQVVAGRIQQFLENFVPQHTQPNASASSASGLGQSLRDTVTNVATSFFTPSRSASSGPVPRQDSLLTAAATRCGPQIDNEQEPGSAITMYNRI